MQSLHLSVSKSVIYFLSALNHKFYHSSIYSAKNVPGALAAMKKLRSIVGYFEKSTQATSKLLNFQSKSDVKEYKEQPRPKKLLQDVVTRWWSTYRMLRRARFLKKAIMGLLAAEEVSCDTMSASEWAILHQIEINL